MKIKKMSISSGGSGVFFETSDKKKYVFSQKVINTIFVKRPTLKQLRYSLENDFDMWMDVAENTSIFTNENVITPEHNEVCEKYSYKFNLVEFIKKLF